MNFISRTAAANWPRNICQFYSASLLSCYSAFLPIMQNVLQLGLAIFDHFTLLLCCAVLLFCCSATNINFLDVTLFYRALQLQTGLATFAHFTLLVLLCSALRTIMQIFLMSHHSAEHCSCNLAFQYLATLL